MSGAEADDRWLWPDELDALVAAAAHHLLLLENEQVRVLETKIAAGETTAVHTHRWPNGQYILKSSEFVRRDGEGSVLFDTRAADGRRPEPWTTHWSKPLPPNSIENVGENGVARDHDRAERSPGRRPRLLSQTTPRAEGRCEENDAPPSGPKTTFSMSRLIV